MADEIRPIGRIPNWNKIDVNNVKKKRPQESKEDLEFKTKLDEEIQKLIKKQKKR